MEATCEQRIRGYYESRMETIYQYVEASGVTDSDEITDQMLDELDEPKPADRDVWEPDIEALREKAQERIWEMPLSVEVFRTVKILLGTGGPGDWFECRLDTDNGIERIDYHFNDWFDHAEINVSDDDTARAFCEQFTESMDIPQ